MSVAMPTSLNDAMAVLADDPAAAVLAGGTDLMVELNYGHRRPAAVVSLRRVEELAGWRELADGRLWLGARLTYREMQQPPLADRLPALAQAARTVGSPQIRATGTLGGNLATASPAGDTLPVLASLDATVQLVSRAGGRRQLPVTEFLKIGTRNAMVIAVANCALAVDAAARRVRCTLGSVGPVPIRCEDAEAWLDGHLTWDGPGGAPRPDGDVAELAAEFGRRCAAAARPIDDHRSTAAYRRHASGALARRALARVLDRPRTETATEGAA
jgi:CO/xanthine dehydrogenase FAD-binding subunit